MAGGVNVACRRVSMDGGRIEGAGASNPFLPVREDGTCAAGHNLVLEPPSITVNVTMAMAFARTLADLVAQGD